MKTFIPYVRTNIELKSTINGWEQKFEFINTRSGENEAIEHYDVLYVLNQINNLKSFKIFIQIIVQNNFGPDTMKYVPVNNINFDSVRNGVVLNRIVGNTVKNFNAQELFDKLKEFEGIDKFFICPSDIDNEIYGLYNYSILIDHYNKVIVFNYLEN